MALLHFGLADIELSCLTVVIGETLRPFANFGPGFFRWERPESNLVIFPRTAFGPAP